MKVAMLGFAIGTAALLLTVIADEPQATKSEKGPKSSQADANPSDGLKKISEKGDVWLDAKRNAIVVDGEVCLRQGFLEMFACPKGTKEHESVVSLNCLAQEVHAGLLAVGAKSGTTVVFNPEYKPATGQVIDVYVLWKDEQGNKQQARGQDWVNDRKTGKALAYDWVFAGSGFWKDDDGKEHYKANGGDLICVSNFPTAMLDLPVKSSEANDDLAFEAFTDHIPPKGTKVRVVLIPRSDKKAGTK